MDDDRIPSGYRQAIITAITVFLGFSMTFLRTFKSLQTKEGWPVLEQVTEIVILAGVVLQVVSLFRALEIADNSTPRYRRTRLIFMAGVIFVIFGGLLSIPLRS